MYYTVYKITNWFNGKIYIGIHKTDDLNDNYMGSSKYLKNSIEKYGLGYFTREYLQIFDNPDDMYEMEAQLVNNEFINNINTYNLKKGGLGGWDFVNKNMNIEHCKLGQQNFCKRKEDLKFAEYIKQKVREIKIKRYGLNYNALFKGKNHSEETKQKISNTTKERLKDPTKNSQFGTMWICNVDLQENKKIKKDEIIPSGWIAGRNKWKT